MKCRVQRNVLSHKVNHIRVDMCAPPSYNYLNLSICPNERTSLCILRRGSLTVEAALIMPFFLMVLLTFFSFFSHYASAAELKGKAAAEAKKVGIVMGSMGAAESGDVTIYKTAQTEWLWVNPFQISKQVVQKAVCRGWIGFTELGITETYVYITPEGSVYHLYSDCTHLNLSIRQVDLVTAKKSKNDYGQKYRKCELCNSSFGILVYITSEGDCYHSERSCSGLKRTIRQVPLSQVSGRSACIRCMSREE